MDSFGGILVATITLVLIAENVAAAKGPACDWIICNRRRHDEVFSCNNSYIFVETVTDFWGATNDVAYQNVRQMCMGARSCDPSKICRGLREELLRVRYVCVEVPESSINQRCEWPVGNIWKGQGHIMSPNYPAPYMYQTCSWRVTAPEDRFVHISVHEVSSRSASDTCDLGLNITYQVCSTGDVQSRLYCGGKMADTDFIACGSVSVQLGVRRRNDGVRFWLSFEVTSSPERAVRPPLLRFVRRCTHGEGVSSSILSSHVLQRPVLRALDPTVVMDTSTQPVGEVTLSTTSQTFALTSTQAPGSDGDGFNTTVIIIVVSTVGAMLVMAIVLAVVFLKRPKVERVEHVYAVPTTRDLASGTWPPKLDDPPVLKENYCAVADALPSSPKLGPMSPPGYAEVEDVCKGGNCRWNPHTFTFGPSLAVGRANSPSDLPFSKTTPNIAGLTLANPPGKPLAPGHTRTFSDSSHRLFSESPFVTRSPLSTRSFRDPQITDYENVIISGKDKSPQLILSEQNSLLQSRLGRVAAKTPISGVKCVSLKTPTVPGCTDALYATSHDINRDTPVSARLSPRLSKSPVYVNYPRGSHGNSTGHSSPAPSRVPVINVHSSQTIAGSDVDTKDDNFECLYENHVVVKS